MMPRASKDGPFCWQSKPALRVVSDACEGRTDLAHVLAVYLALSWIASDAQAETFTASKAQIAQRAGVSYRKAADVLALLVRLGLVESAENLIPGTKEKGPNTYTLGTVCATSSTECLRLGTAPKIDPCRDYMKNLSEESEESPEGAPRRVRVKFAPPSQADWTAYAATLGFPAAAAGQAFDFYQSNGWRVGKNPMRDWKAAVRTCYGRWKTDARTARPAQPQPARAAVC